MSPSASRPGRWHHLRGSNQYFDEETGLHYNLRRELDPDSGRYLCTGPHGQGSFNDMLQRLLEHTLAALPTGSGRAYEEWLEDLPTAAAVLAVWRASHAVGIGFIAGTAIVGMAFNHLSE